MSEKILVADDSPTLQRVVQSVLAGQGFEVVLASDGVEAIRKFYAERPDLVLCDIQMPKMNGYLVCRLLKEDWSAATVPFIMLTSHDAAGDRYWGLKTGADAYLTKDFDARQLVDAVRSTLDSVQNRPQIASADPISYMGDSEILGRVSDLLDKKLYEATLVNEINGLAAMIGDYRETVASLLAVLATFIDFTMAAVGLVEEGDVGIRVNHPVTAEDFERMAAHVVDNLSAYSSQVIDLGNARLWSADPYSHLGAGTSGDPLTTFVAMPLRAQGRVIGLLALGSATPHAFSEKELAVLRVIEAAAAVVVDNARLYDQAKVG